MLLRRWDVEGEADCGEDKLDFLIQKVIKGLPCLAGIERGPRQPDTGRPLAKGVRSPGWWQGGAKALAR